MSPTNTWPLKRIGALLAEKLVEWLQRQDLGLPDRARAYDLVPDPPAATPGTASDVAARLVLDSFREKLGYVNILLCTDGSLGGPNYTARLPGEVLDVWSPETARVFFCPQKKKVLAREVSPLTRKRLASWKFLDSADHDQILRALKDESRTPPRPARLETLASLWSFAEQKTRGDWEWTGWWQTAAIVPVAGRDYLGRAKDILPSRGRPDQCSEDDWRFILDRAEVLDQEWSEMLAQLQADREGVKHRIQQAIGRSFSDEDAARLLSGFRQTKLGETARLEQVFEQVAKRVFGNQTAHTGERIRLVHVAARLNVNVTRTVTLLYLCQDGAWRCREDDLVCRSGLDLERLLPQEWLNAHLISDLYERELEAAFVPKWREWLVAPGKGGLAAFTLPRRKETRGWSLNPQFFRSRGVETPTPTLKQGAFLFGDWDWEPVLWDHWKQLQKGNDAEAWRDIAWGVVSSWSELWRQRLTMDIRQEGYSKVHRVDDGGIPSSWIHALRGSPCLPDQFNRLHLPAELFRRTADTLPLLDVEPFVHDRWDTPEHEAALQALGVRSEPTDASVLIGRLKALSQAEDPPLGPLRDLYRAIERVAARLPADRSVDLVRAFEELALIRTESGWARRQFCFRENPDGIPGMAVIHREFRDVLGLWERLKIRQQPALDDALEWLTSIPSAETLKEPQHRSVRRLLAFYPQEVWCRSGRWLDLQGRLAPTRGLRWGCVDARFAAGLFSSVRSEAADFSMVERSRWAEFAGNTLPLIDGRIEHRPKGFLETPGWSGAADDRWLQTLGHVLRRWRYPDGSEAIAAQADRAAAERLTRTRCKRVDAIRVQKFLDGTPAGPESDAMVIWHDDVLYIRGTPASLFKPLVLEIVRHFSTQEARDVIQDCLARDPAWIQEYAKDHLRLEEPTEPGVPPIETGTETEAGVLPPEEPGESGPAQEPVRGVTGTREPPPPPSPPKSPTPPHKPPAPSEFDRLMTFFQSRGFRWDPQSETFAHPDGSIICKCEGVFRWELRRADARHPIWVASTTLTGTKGVEVPAEVWMAGENCDAWLLEPAGDTFIKHRFAELRRAVNEGRLDLFSALYRIRKRTSEQPTSSPS